MATPTDEFYTGLLTMLDELREQSAPEQSSFFNRPMSDHELVEYLSFQAYYEYRAAEFIGRWLTHTPEHDAFVLLAQQVEDEALHYEYFMRSLTKFGVTSLDSYRPEPEWEEWIDVWYPSGSDTLERVSAHNVTGELGACQAFQEIKPRLPEDVQKTFARIIPDEHFHMRLGKQLVLKYCVSDDQQARVRERVRSTFALEQQGRLAFNRRMARLGVADIGDPIPPLA
jgi:tRNA isopentenyl-2-thiomethyl-A-37 hydroxylase MiaE